MIQTIQTIQRHAIETFDRYEKKYVIGEDLFCRLIGMLASRMEPDINNLGQAAYPVSSIYYDTEDSYLVRTSKSNPIYKEKLRLRSYGTPEEGATVYVEIKKKFVGRTSKRRSGLKLDEAYGFLATGKLPVIRPYMNAQVLGEISYMLSTLTLAPACLISYRRMAYEDKASGLRVSFDTDILARGHDLSLESGAFGERLLEERQRLMEIKTPGAIPLWLSGLLCEFEVYPCSFSKYATAYDMGLVAGLGPAPAPVAAFVPALPKTAGQVTLARAD